MKRSFATWGGLIAGFILGFTPVLLASRSSSGTYTLPAGNPVVTGTTITSTWANNTMSDVGTEITNSLDRNGRGSMSAPLKLSAGSSSAPAIAWSAETDTGLYRAASQDIRMQVNATQSQKWTASGVTIPGVCTVQNGAAVTTGTTNGTAVTATGNGTGNGVGGTGGSTSGAGGYFTGGAPNGNGVTAVGDGAGSGGNFTGGDSSGTGAVFAGGASNGRGLTAVGDGSGDGAHCTGGDNSGDGLTATGGASNGDGVVATGDGTGKGIVAVGGDSSGAGGDFTGGAPNGAGIVTDGTGSGAAIDIGTGYASFSGGNVTPTTGYSNKVTPSNIVKAWSRFTLNGTGSPTVASGFNVASVSASGVTGTMTIADDLSAGNYACSGTAGPVGSSTAYTVPMTTSSGSAVTFEVWALTVAPAITQLSLSVVSGIVVTIICVGNQ